MKKIVSGLMALCLVTLVGCAGGGSPAIGAWDIQLTSPLGPLPVVMVINEDGTGTFSSDLGAAEFSGIVFDGNTVSFPIELDVQGNILALQFSGTVTGDTITGEAVSDFGPFAASGTRQ